MLGEGWRLLLLGRELVTPGFNNTACNQQILFVLPFTSAQGKKRF